MGKITVVKNNALPKLIYALSSLPNQPIETVKIIEKRVYEFIRDGKPEKIKRDILTMRYENGGLKMIDIDNFIKALKVCWIKLIIETDNDLILNRIYIFTIFEHLAVIFCLNVITLKTTFVNLRKIYF